MERLPDLAAAESASRNRSVGPRGAHRCGRACSNWARHYFRAYICSSASQVTPPSTPAAEQNLDLTDRPITNADWLRKRFAEIRALTTEPERRRAIDELVHWTDPGPGGFYDDLGDPMNRPHLFPGDGFEKDPAFFHTPRTGFASRRDTPWRISSYRHAEALYGNSLRLHYTGLDPAAQYRVRFVEAGDATPHATRLVANGKWEIHPAAQEGSRSETGGVRHSRRSHLFRRTHSRMAARSRRIRQRPLGAGFPRCG